MNNPCVCRLHPCCGCMLQTPPMLWVYATDPTHAVGVCCRPHPCCGYMLQTTPMLWVYASDPTHAVGVCCRPHPCCGCMLQTPPMLTSMLPSLGAMPDCIQEPTTAERRNVVTAAISDPRRSLSNYFTVNCNIKLLKD